MKKIILLLFILLPAISFAQTTIVLRSDTNSVYVGTFEHPKNTLRARYSDSGLAIFGTDNTVFIADRKYNTYTNASTGSAFTSFDTLKAWVRENFFVDAPSGTSGGGGDTATLTSVTTGAGNNVTPNAIQVTGFGNIDPTISSIALLDQGTNGGLFKLGGGASLGSVQITDQGDIQLASSSSTFVLRAQTGINAAASIAGRVEGENGVNSGDFVTMSQTGILKSGNAILTGDAIATTFTVTHSFGSTGYEATITPTNLLSGTSIGGGYYVTNKTTTTFDVTFVTAPAVGALNIDWTIHKN